MWQEETKTASVARPSTAPPSRSKPDEAVTQSMSKEEISAVAAAAGAAEEGGEGAAAAAFEQFEKKVARLLKAAGARKQLGAPPQQSAIWTRLQNPYQLGVGFK